MCFITEPSLFDAWFLSTWILIYFLLIFACTEHCSVFDTYIYIYIVNGEGIWTFTIERFVSIGNRFWNFISIYIIIYIGEIWNRWENKYRNYKYILYCKCIFNKELVYSLNYIKHVLVFIISVNYFIGCLNTFVNSAKYNIYMYIYLY